MTRDPDDPFPPVPDDWREYRLDLPFPWHLLALGAVAGFIGMWLLLGRQP